MGAAARFLSGFTDSPGPDFQGVPGSQLCIIMKIDYWLPKSGNFCLQLNSSLPSMSQRTGLGYAISYHVQYQSYSGGHQLYFLSLTLTETF